MSTIPCIFSFLSKIFWWTVSNSFLNVFCLFYRMKNLHNLDMVHIFLHIIYKAQHKYWVNLFPIYFKWSLQDRCFSSKTPRKFTDSTLSTFCLLISNLGNKKGISSFLLALWKREYIVFPMLRKSLFASRDSLIFSTPY